MPTPIGHSLAGVAAALLAGPPRRLRTLIDDRAALGATVLLANLADLDFVVGALLGDLHAYHAGASHGLPFALVAALVATVLRSGLSPRRRFAVALAILLTHPLLDLLQSYRGLGLTAGVAGLPLLAPFTWRGFRSPVAVLLGIRHRTWGQVWSVHNALAVLLELAWLLPLVVVADRVGRRRLRAAQR